uniref:Zinc finger protein AEBP2-like n=1 Tax=Petromyzon marinus TaxID=7757 RepID=A0AAJ7UG51_PETMA|nr:zinc finger protein AEBP2-like [Petromyzon marinus]
MEAGGSQAVSGGPQALSAPRATLLKREAAERPWPGVIVKREVVDGFRPDAVALSLKREHEEDEEDEEDEEEGEEGEDEEEEPGHDAWPQVKVKQEDSANASPRSEDDETGGAGGGGGRGLVVVSGGGGRQDGCRGGGGAERRGRRRRRRQWRRDGSRSLA